jgi:hypothetical protein
MAFVIPSHLPRGAYPRASGSASSSSPHTLVLQAVSDATANAKLTVDVANAWVSQVDASIANTHERIRKRIADDQPAFERQMRSSVRLKSNFEELAGRVDTLDSSVNNPDVRMLLDVLRITEESQI